MGRNHDWLGDDPDEVFGPVERFEDMVKNHTRCFFDVHEFEAIIDYYLDTENFGFAAKAAKYAVGMYPSSTSIQQRISEILIDKGQPVEALGILERIGKMEPDNADILVLKGDALIMTGKTKEARRVYEKAYARADHDDKDALAFHIGVSLEKAEQYHLALRYLQDVLLLNPQNYAVFYDLAFCYDKIGKSDKSIEYYNKYLNEDPFSENVWYNLGFSYGVSEQFEKSLQAYDFAIALNSQYASAYFNKANLQAHLDHYPEAIVTYKEFLALEPDNAQAHCYLAECYEKLNDREMATEYYRQALALNPELADAWAGMGMLYFDENNYKSSIAHLQHAIRLDPDNPEYYFTLGTVYNAYMRPEKAAAAFRKCLEDDPDEPEALSGLYAAMLQLKRAKSARELLDKLTGMNPEEPARNFREAAYHFTFGSMSDGYKWLARALSDAPDAIDDFFRLYPIAVNDPDLIAFIRPFTSSTSTQP